ncbi:class I SAM-dependent methyltransferase [Burkholderia sp. L27(2015)]|uniref:class I SAM-dependent methyltransferase n=1 Tax=Burkholderia sp. L27(2015) TaxID=1641858 RepID=UPI00131C785A|nr:class I SAM-dependent methyltransferase [Burkholderia sp. L27(2015)]
MFDKLSAAFERFQLFCVACLMRSIANRQSVPKATSDGAVHQLLPVWVQLVASRCMPQDPELRASARSMLLEHLPSEAWPLIPSLEKRGAPVMSTWTFQNEVMSWDLAPDDLVLDVGSGGWPFKRANHLADKYPEKTSHRVEAMVRDQRPFFEVDLQRLPFNDRTYDFVFCSHVLEHMDNPGQAIRELVRVGRRGYIEVPTRLSDVMFNFTRLPNHHRWHGIVLGKTLVLTEWNEWERRDLGNDFFNALHNEYANAFQDFFERNRDLFFASYHWDETANFLIIDKEGRIIDSSLDETSSSSQARH